MVLEKKDYNKEEFEFVTEFPCFLGHPVSSTLFIRSMLQGYSWESVMVILA